MSQITVVAEKRDSSGKGVARKLRAQGRIPGVLYGSGGKNSIGFSIEEKAMGALMKEKGLNTILELDIAGDKHVCMIADYQRDVFQRFLLHIDLKPVDLKSKVVVKVPVKLAGEHVVRGKGGIAQLYLRDFKIRVLATEIPHCIDLDISDLEPGQSRKLNSVKIADNLEKMDPPETTVINVIAPRALAAARNAAASAAGT